MKRPTKLTTRPRPIRLKDLPARIVLAKDSDPTSLSFSIEPYLVPDGGADVRPFRRKPPTR